MFTVIGLGHREFQPLFSPRIYATPHARGITTYAQAIFYNANRQQRSRPAPSNYTQPTIGWDTLNWDPDFVTPEWGSEADTSAESKWPWEVFSQANELDSVKVRLNWQAKLIPVTRSRFQNAALDYGASDMNVDLGLSLLHFESMSSH